MKNKGCKCILLLLLSSMVLLGQVPIKSYAYEEERVKSYVEDLTADVGGKTIYVNGPEKYSKAKISSSVKPDDADQTVTYVSSDSNVVSVDNKGELSANNEGSAKISVTTNATKENGKKITKNVAIKVKEFVYPKSISLNCSNTNLKNGQKLTLTAKVMPTKSTDRNYTFKSSNTSLAAVDANGVVTANNNKLTGTVTITAVASENDNNGNEVSASVDIQISSNGEGESSGGSGGDIEMNAVSIHDPSIFQDPESGMYYTYGTHIVAAKSDDAVSWDYIADSDLSYAKGNNLFDKWYIEEFKDIYKWLYSYSDEDIEQIVSGDKKAPEGIWAIDVIYSEEAKKAGNDPYLMYVTVCNGAWKSAIVLCTSDNPDGNFKYKDTIVCSDYTASEVNSGDTNLLDVLKLNDVDEVKEKYGDYYFPDGFRSNGAQVPDCIDPDPYYDEDGNLYLVYGSFTCYGGIRVLKMNPLSGARAEDNYQYLENENEVVSDPYFGKKIANKYGEGPYVLPVKDSSGTSKTGYYYFLFYSEGNLNPYGGYNMRMMRSEYPDHGFEDYAGNSSLSTDISQSYLGTRIMDNYKFSFMDNASTANGGNSAIVTSDGRILLEYHSKSNDGTFGHIVKVQQMFLNEDGWLVTTPYTYKGENLAQILKNEIPGDYEFIYHRLSYTNTGSLNNKYDYVDSVIEKLNEDGTISGTYSGSWSYDEKNNFIEITIGTNVYKGVVLEQGMDDKSKTKTIVFGADGKDNRTVWGSRISKSDDEKAAYDMNSLSIDTVVDSDFILESKGFYGSDITWQSNNEAIKINGSKAEVICQDYDTDVTLTATITNNNCQLTKTFDVTVSAEEISIDTIVRSTKIYLPASTAAGKKITWKSSNTDVISENGDVVPPESGSISVTLTGAIENSDKVLSFDVTVLPTVISDYFYTEDYEDITDALDVCVSTSAQASVSIADDEQHGNYLKFAPGNANSRGASSKFDLDGEIDDVYTVEFDLSLKSGNNQETQFALIGDDYSYTNNGFNDGIDSGYILKLASNNSTKWTLNDSDESADIPAGKWVHVTASVSRNTKKAMVTIEDKDNIYYKGKLSIDGSGSLYGLYIRGGRYQSITGIDNIKVY